MKLVEISEDVCFTDGEIQIVRDIEDSILQNLPDVIEILDLIILAAKKTGNASAYLRFSTLREGLISRGYTDHIAQLGRISSKMERIKKEFE